MEAVFNSKLPFPVKMQQLIDMKMQTVSGLQSELITKMWTDRVLRQYLEEITEKQAKPLMRKIIAQGIKEGYLHAEIPAEAFMLYFDILQAGSEVKKTEIARIANDHQMMMALAKLMYFGIFRKEFSFDSKFAVKIEE